ncbi:MAG: 50S ribosomal protein L25/general stress protein Ctc [Carbonactinosporaceae bacterium]
MAEVRIVAEQRTQFGKGAARRIRRAEKVPAVVYGHGEDPRHISLPGHDLMLALKTPNVLLSVDYNGKRELALPRDVQRDPVKGFLEHVDLLLVRRGEKVGVEVRVQAVGDVAPGGLLDLTMNELPVQAEATNIPGAIEVSIDGLEIGDSVQAKDVKLPAGVTLDVDEEQVVLHVMRAPTAEEVEAELAEAEEGAGIERVAPTEAEGEEEAPVPEPGERAAVSED